MALRQTVPIDFYQPDLMLSFNSSEQDWRELCIQPYAADGLNGFGGVANESIITATTNVAAAATSTTLAGRTIGTSTVLGNIARLDVSTNHRYFCANHSNQVTFSIALASVANVRVWAGLFSADGATIGASDTPTANFLGFRFSTGAGDTEWQCATDNNSGAPNLVNSTVGGATAPINLTLMTSKGDGAVYFFVNEVFRARVTTKVPASSVVTMFPVLCITNLVGGVGSAKDVTYYFVNTRSKAP